MLLRPKRDVVVCTLVTLAPPMKDAVGQWKNFQNALPSQVQVTGVKRPMEISPKNLVGYFSTNLLVYIHINSSTRPTHSHCR